MASFSRLLFYSFFLLLFFGCASTKRYKSAEDSYHSSLSNPTLCKLWERDKDDNVEQELISRNINAETCEPYEYEQPYVENNESSYTPNKQEYSVAEALIDLAVIAASVSSSGDSAKTRAMKAGVVQGYFSNKNQRNGTGEHTENCSCPYDKASDGTRCGDRSAWSRPNGNSPSCEWSKLTVEDIKGRKLN